MNNWKCCLYWASKSVLGLVVGLVVMYSGSVYSDAYMWGSGPYQFTADKQRVWFDDGVYERDDYPYVGANIILSTASSYNPDHGDFWSVSIDDKNTGQRLGSGVLVYDAASDCLFFNGSPTPYCGLYIPPGTRGRDTLITVFFRTQCMDTRDYVLVLEDQGSFHYSWDFRPTRFKPDIFYADFDSFIQPDLPGDTYVFGNTLDPIQPTSATAGVVIEDNLGCLKRLEDVEVSLKNTITGAAGHAHLSGKEETGSGKYTALNPDTDKLSDPILHDVQKKIKNDVLVSAEKYTAIPGIEGKTNKFGVFLTKYTGGRLGVEEKIEIEAKRPRISAKDLESSDIDEVNLDIKVPGLVPIPDTGDYHRFKYGGTCKHSPTARWVSADMYPRVISLAALYARDTSTKDYTYILSFNDASTSFGGLFDNQGSAGIDVRCHGSHRRGIDIDINGDDWKINKSTLIRSRGEDMYHGNVTVNGRIYTKTELLKELAAAVGFEKVREPSIHYRNHNHR